MYARSTGMFSDGKRTHEFDVIERVRTESKPGPKHKRGGVPASPLDATVIAPALADMIAWQPPRTEVRVYIRLKQRPQTNLRRSRAPLGFASLAWADQERAEHHARILARQNEVAALQASLIGHPESLGAREVTGFWLGGSVGAIVPLGAISAIAAHADVARIAPAAKERLDGSWTGTDMKNTHGLDAKWFIDNGFDGDLHDPDFIRIAVIDFTGFDLNHTGFKEAATGTRIVRSQDNPDPDPDLYGWYCDDLSCTPNAGAPTGDHGTRVAGLAGGDHRDGQVSGKSADWENSSRPT